MKTILLSAAASLMMVGAAAAMGAGNPAPDSSTGVVSRFVVSVPAADTGSQAYPSTQGAGASGTAGRFLGFNPALLHSPDTGSQQMPVGLR
jgi:hypothetical protein